MYYDRKQVGKHLQELRRAAGFKSARAFADYAGINTSTYTDFEQGNRPLSLERAWQLADVLEVSLDELAGREFVPAAEPATRLETLCESLNEVGLRKVEQYAEDIAQNPANTEELKNPLPDYPVPQAAIA